MKKSKQKKSIEVIIPRDFVNWWEPWGVEEITGASKGGHPDSHRMWSRPETDGSYTRRMYGIKTKVAWMCEYFRNEFLEWRQIGSPQKKDFVSMAATPAKQKEFWMDILPFTLMIGQDKRYKEQIEKEYKTDELLPTLLEKYKLR